MSTRKSLAWSFSQQAGQYALQFVGSVVIARLLTPHEVGVFALAMAANFLISSLRQFGVGSYLIREENLTDKKVRTAFGVWIATSWTLGFIVLALRGYLADAYDTPGIEDVLTLVSLNFFVTPLGQPANALLVRGMRFDLLHHITLTSVLVSVGTNIVLALMGFSYMALAWGMIAGTAVRSALLIAVRSDHIRLLPSFHHWRDVLSFGGWVTGASVINTISSEGTKFIVGGILNPAALALYERSLQLPVAIRMVISRPLGRVLLPAYAKLSRDKQRLDHSFLKVASLTNVLIWPPLFVLGFLSVPVVVFVFGEQWRAAGEIMPYIIGARIALTLVPNQHEILVATGEVRKLFGINFVLMMVGLVSVAAASHYGLVVFAVVVFFRAILASALFYYALAPIVRFSRRSFLLTHLRSLAVAAFASIPAAAGYIAYGSQVPFEIILAIVGASAAFWLIAAVLLKHEILQEFSGVLASLKGARGSPANRSD